MKQISRGVFHPIRKECFNPSSKKPAWLRWGQGRLETFPLSQKRKVRQAQFAFGRQHGTTGLKYR
ncbi:MAG TPA: hypothetical protein DIW64_01170 [Cellvibrio sp.]|nr:hypothetical protein [Cellvibrio sp.]